MPSRRGAGPTASTRVVAVIGDPVGHSLSPVLHNAAFAARNLDWVYVALEVSPENLSTAVAGARALGLAGLSVTMPHKEAMVSVVDRLSPMARRLRSVNTVINHGRGDLLGDSTDGRGLIDHLRLDEGFDPSGSRCVVLGSGGAARAVVAALGEASAERIGVLARRSQAARECASLAPGAGVLGDLSDISSADLVINATPVGMAAGISSMDGSEATPSLPMGVKSWMFRESQLVVDLIYSPPHTPLLVAAKAEGARTANGFGMLLHQAGRQFELWTQQSPPLDVMSAAAMAELAQRRAPTDTI